MVSDIVAFMGNKCPATLTHRFEYLRFVVSHRVRI